jgi:hypothetical protein
VFLGGVPAIFGRKIVVSLWWNRGFWMVKRGELCGGFVVGKTRQLFEIYFLGLFEQQEMRRPKATERGLSSQRLTMRL